MSLTLAEQLEIRVKRIEDRLNQHIQNISDCIEMADQEAENLGHMENGRIRRHLGYARTLINKTQTGDRHGH